MAAPPTAVLTGSHVLVAGRDEARRTYYEENQTDVADMGYPLTGLWRNARYRARPARFGCPSLPFWR